VKDVGTVGSEEERGLEGEEGGKNVSFGKDLFRYEKTWRKVITPSK